MKETFPTNRYHHGDLRNALIIAAAELIEERGSTEFAMVDAARVAGVSSAAPYRHFQDKDDLLAAVCELAFLGLTEQTRITVAAHTAGSEACIVALGKAYQLFALEHAALYDLMWGKRSVDILDTEIKVKGSGFHLFVEQIGLWCENHINGPSDPMTIAVQMWGMAHGMVALSMTGHIPKFLPGAEITDLLTQATHSFLRGLEETANSA